MAWDVPRPSGGYWYRLEQGGVSEQEPLPVAPPGAAAEIELGKRRWTATQPVPEDPAPVEGGEPGHAPDIDVPHDPRGPHEAKGKATASAGQSMVRTISGGQTVSAAESQKPDSGGKVQLLTRKELYDQVWKKTLKTVAKEYETNYTELVRLCEALNVPRPPQGYRGRISRGLPVEQTPLPDAGQQAATEADFDAQQSPSPKSASSMDQAKNPQAPACLRKT